MNKLKILIRDNKRLMYVLFGLLGGLGGYAYYYYIGCAGGACPITSNPYMSILWGVVMGVLTVNLFEPNTSKDE